MTARYIRFLGLAALVVTALMGIGFLPTRRLAGEAALPAMLVGCLISLAAALMAGWLLVGAGGKTPTARMQAAFVAMVVRLDRYVNGNRRALAVVRVPTEAEEQARWVSRLREQVRRHRQRLEAQGRCLLLTQGIRVSGRW